MNYLTGLEWSAGLFGLSIGIVIGCVATWFSLRPKANYSMPGESALIKWATDTHGESPFLNWAMKSPPDVVEIPETELVIYGDVPAIPPGNPLHARMFERWLEAEGMGDRFMQNRQEGRMLLAGIEPPTSREEAESQLTKLKGASL